MKSVTVLSHCKSHLSPLRILFKPTWKQEKVGCSNDLGAETANQLDTWKLQTLIQIPAVCVGSRRSRPQLAVGFHILAAPTARHAGSADPGSTHHGPCSPSSAGTAGNLGDTGLLPHFFLNCGVCWILHRHI